MGDTAVFHFCFNTILGQKRKKRHLINNECHKRLMSLFPFPGSSELASSSNNICVPNDVRSSKSSILRAGQKLAASLYTCRSKEVMLLSRQVLSHLKLLGIFYETFLTMNQVVTWEGVALIQRKGIKHKKRIPVLTHNTFELVYKSSISKKKLGCLGQWLQCLSIMFGNACQLF